MGRRCQRRAIFYGHVLIILLVALQLSLFSDTLPRPVFFAFASAPQLSMENSALASATSLSMADVAPGALG
jgi:hypothetical protein